MTTSETRPTDRKQRTQTVLQVQQTSRLSPHMVRVVLGGEGFVSFNDNDFTDKYVKILFARPDLGLTPPYDMDRLREQLPVSDLPSRRTYTVRWVDHEAQRLAIDFVVHADEGIAGPWAAAARPGDVLALSGAGGGYAPDPAVHRHLLVGDESAFPAIASALEALAPDAMGLVILQAATERDRIELSALPEVDVRWTYRDADGPDGLDEAVRSAGWAPGRVHVFAHGERAQMKALRQYFVHDRGVAGEDLSLSAYWALGRAEDTFQAEKREPIGQL